MLLFFSENPYVMTYLYILCLLVTDLHFCSGAIKSNIGHLEGASGIAGIIKTILTLERAVIPPNANFRSINPKIDADSLRIKV